MNYKYEKYRNPDFPIYCSVQMGCGQLVKPHFHHAAELIWITSGEAELFLNTEKHIIREHQVYFIPQNCIHSVYSYDESTKINGVVFESTLLDKKVLPTETDDILSFVNIKDFCCGPEDDCEIQIHLDKLINAYFENELYGNIEILSNLYAIICLLLKKYNRSTEQNAVYNRITPVIEFLQKNYSKKITISDLSGILHICNDHFIRLFKLHTNKTPTKFLTDLRIENAMKMLAQTELPISEISVAVGFQNPNYMCKVFKQTLGMTPNEYRKTRLG